MMIWKGLMGGIGAWWERYDLTHSRKNTTNLLWVMPLEKAELPFTVIICYVLMMFSEKYRAECRGLRCRW